MQLKVWCFQPWLPPFLPGLEESFVSRQGNGQSHPGKQNMPTWSCALPHRKNVLERILLIHTCTPAAWTYQSSYTSRSPEICLGQQKSQFCTYSTAWSNHYCHCKRHKNQPSYHLKQQPSSEQLFLNATENTVKRPLVVYQSGAAVAEIKFPSTIHISPSSSANDDAIIVAVVAAVAVAATATTIINGSGKHALAEVRAAENVCNLERHKQQSVSNELFESKQWERAEQ